MTYPRLALQPLFGVKNLLLLSLEPGQEGQQPTELLKGQSEPSVGRMAPMLAS